ncbi:MAG: GGDEF domain-containing protein [Nitrospiraceae bacterium]|nr:MAG: GGDEF domain-containing protein [Nitrospiraceae bacterium]
MGGPLQEILQGRGGKKRTGPWIKKGAPLFFLISTWLALLIDFPFKQPILWFALSLVTAILLTSLHIKSSRKDFSIEFLFSLALVLSGIAKAYAVPWLKLAFFPFIIGMSVFYGMGTIITLSFLLPFLELRTFLSLNDVIHEVAFSVFLILTAVISPLIMNTLKREKEQAVSSLKLIKESARNIADDTESASVRSDKIMSHYFASMMKTDEELRELLSTLKHAVFADAAYFFAQRGTGFFLRCTTESNSENIITGNGIIAKCFADRTPFSSPEIDEKTVEVGYIKDGKITSLIAFPVMDGSTLLGVLTVDSARYQAFSDADRNIVQMFIPQIVKALERERIYPRIQRDYDGLKTLHEESAKLVSSLNTDVIVKKLCEGASTIAASSAFFFISKKKKFQLIHHTGTEDISEKVFDLKGTFLSMVVENRQPIYMSDTSDYRIPIMPFKFENVHSVFALPMLYETSIIGVFVLLSEKTGFLDTFQVELLKVLCNQASTSIANAQLHSEIEKMATTDGLTGLFNHRVFQEKLSEELKRLNRFSETISLMLVDIDFFKKINDTYGHPVGDLVLKNVSKVVEQTIRDIDIPARYGGEEFAIILPRTDETAAENIAERLRKAVEEKSFIAQGKTFNITVSIGIATAPSNAKGKEELIDKADQALYFAKQSGRNNSVLWNVLK